MLGDTLCESNNHGSTILLAIIWVVMHVYLLLDTKFSWIMRNYVRLQPLPPTTTFILMDI